MATIIDALLVTLGLDDSQFTKARARADDDWKKTANNATKSGKEQEAAAKKSAQAMSKLRGEVISLGLAFLGIKSIKDFVANQIQMTAALGRSSEAFGVNVNSLNAWKDMSQEMGSSAQAAFQVFGKLVDMRANFIRNPGAFANNPAFRQLFSGSMGSVRGLFQQGPEAVLYHLADQYQGELSKAKASGDPNAQGDLQATYRQRLQELLGLDDAWVDALEKGTPALRAQIDAYKEHDRITKQDTEAARQFNTELSRVQRDVEGVARTVLTPTLGFLADTMELLGGTTKPVGQYIRDVALGFYALTHPLETMLHLMASSGAIPKWADPTTNGFDPVYGQLGQWAAGGPGHPGDPNAPGGGSPGGGTDKPTANLEDAMNQYAQASGRGAGSASYGAGNSGAVGRTDAGASKIQAYFQANGFSREQAMGIAAGIAAEGGSLGQAKGGGFGIGQWLGKRRDRLFAQYGHAPTLDQQLEFMRGELMGGDPGGRAVRGQTTAVGTFNAYWSQFMRPQTRDRFGRINNYGVLQQEQARGMAFLHSRLAGLGTQGAPGHVVNIHVDARGATDPHKIAHVTGQHVKRIIQPRNIVANANSGTQ